MSYGSATDDERVLSYAAPKDTSTSASQSQVAVPMPSSSSPTAPPPPSSSTGNDGVSTMFGLPSAATDRVVDYARNTWCECRPWSEFYSTAAISMPPFATLSDRFSTNLHLYRANYQVLATFWLAVFFIGSIPSFLIAIVLFFLLARLCTRRALRNGGKLSHRDTVLAAFAALIIIWITGIAEHALVSLAVSALFIAAHAALHEPSTVETEITTV